MESITKSPEETKILNLCAPVLEGHGFSLVDLDCRIGGRSLIRLFIERTQVDSAVSLEDCATVSREVGPVLEAFDLIPGTFDLEVSSPGLDRRMRTRPDFEGALGYRVKLRLNESVASLGSKPSGLLKEVRDDGIVVEVDRRDHPISWDQIRQANRIWPGPEAETHLSNPYRN